MVVATCTCRITWWYAQGAYGAAHHAALCCKRKSVQCTSNATDVAILSADNDILWPYMQ
jgi:hypothetical protein